MSTFFVDATVPLRWGPHPVVGIPRVEFAIVRQAMRQKTGKVRFFKVERSGQTRVLGPRELNYLARLVEGRIRSIEDGADERFMRRLSAVVGAIRDGAAHSGKEFDRVSASYLSGRTDRRGLSYQCAKTLVRGLKLSGFGGRGRSEATDPLTIPGARCFLSSAGLHHLAASGRAVPETVHISTVLHDLIPIEQPHLTDRSHARNFERDVNWMFAHCRQIICVSNHTAERAAAHAARSGMTAPPRIAVSQLGSFLKEALRGQAPEPVAGLAGQRFAFYCSTIEIRKNHILLLKLWSVLAEELGDRLPKLVFGGRWGWMYGEVREYLDAHPALARHLVILNDMSDQQLAWLYGHAAFGLYPSLAEGWGLGAAESLDFGLPIIISDTPSLAEATQGLMPVLPAGDLAAWRDEVCRAVGEPAWAERLRQRIRLAYRPIDETVFANRLLSLVDTATATRLPPAPAGTPTRPDEDHAPIAASHAA